MAPTSQTSWYHHPAIIILAGGAATYTVYKLYLASNRLPPSTLHRSNAIHHRRRQQDLPMTMPSPASEGMSPIIFFRNPARDAPLGELEIVGDRSDPQAWHVILKLGHDYMPPIESFEDMLPSREYAYWHIFESALKHILAVCAQLRDQPEAPVRETQPGIYDFDQRTSTKHLTPLHHSTTDSFKMLLSSTP